LVPKSHDTAVVAVMFHISFHQVACCFNEKIVSASQDGTVTIWDPSTGSKIFQYQNAHGVTCLFDL
jgi:WD40 repeat protein